MNLSGFDWQSPKIPKERKCEKCGETYSSSKLFCPHCNPITTNFDWSLNTEQNKPTLGDIGINPKDIELPIQQPIRKPILSPSQIKCNICGATSTLWHKPDCIHPGKSLIASPVTNTSQDGSLPWYWQTVLVITTILIIFSVCGQALVFTFYSLQEALIELMNTVNSTIEWIAIGIGGILGVYISGILTGIFAHYITKFIDKLLSHFA